MLKVFLDTMIYLHYRQLDEIDFHELLKAENISIVIPRITIKELDHQKNTNKSNKIKSRAKKILNKIENWLDNNSIKSNLYVESYHELPSIEFDKYGLDKSWNDDLLIASIIKYKVNNPDDDILFITQDTGPRLTAKRIGIKYLELPEIYKLPIELDPIEIENKELHNQLEKVKNALPELNVIFSESDNQDNRVNYILEAPPPIDDEYEDRIIRDLLNKYPPKNPPTLEISNNSINVSASTVLMDHHLNKIPIKEYERYNKEVDDYIISYKKYLNDLYKYKSSTSYTITFQIGISNIGKVPAEDVDITLHFPDGFILFSENEHPEPPKKPKQPIEPMSQLHRSLSFANDQFPEFNMPILERFEHLSSFSIKKTHSYEVKDHFNRIKHGDIDYLPELSIMFDSYESAKSFNCDYVLRPSNLPEPKKGQLHFIINKK